MKSSFTHQTAHHRIATYSTLARSFRKTQGNQKLLKAAAQGTLSVALPAILATLPTHSAKAQCGYNTATETGDGICNLVLVDLDGDSSFDVSFGAYGIRRAMRVLNTTAMLSVVGYPNPGMTGPDFFASNISTSSAITTGLGFIPITDSIYLRYDPTGQFPTGSFGNIALSFNGQLGFVNLTVELDGCITINSFGLNPTAGAPVVAGNCGSLPVELAAFQAKAVEKGVELIWKTASETNNAGFEIQRSTDGKSFQKIAWMDGQGTTVEPTEYMYKDEKVAPNQTYYYRLKQVDVDGTAALSTVQKVMVVDKNQIVIEPLFPNPVAASVPEVQLNVLTAEAEEAVITLYDVRGQVVRISELQLQAGTNAVGIAKEGVQAGNYFVKIQVAGQVNYERLMVQ